VPVSGVSATLGYLSSLFPPPPAAGVPGDPGLFGPGSEVWRVGRERALLAGGPAALLLQLAHPLVAAGVAEHSGFEADPVRRLRGTLDATLTVVFGDRQQAAAASARVATRHRPVHGRITVGVGRYPAGSPYRAGDLQLALWVHATLVCTAVEAYEAFVGPLTRRRRDRYHREMSRFAAVFGVPADLLPGSYAGLQDYVRSMDEDGILEVGPQARGVAEQLLRAGAEGLPAPLAAGAGAITRVLAAGLLPPRLRGAYGLSWSRPDQEAFLGARLAARAALPGLPRGLRFWPHYLTAQRRLRWPRASAVGSG
jgi:uncharacterized protein (DUF2236 family)